MKLCYNRNAIHLIEKKLEENIFKRNDLWMLSMNPNAVSLLEKHLELIDWWFLSKNPNSVHFLEKNLDKIDWIPLSSNPNAIDLLEKNLDKIDWLFLSKNPNIFELDYGFLKQRMDIVREELMMKAWHPSRVEKWLDAGMELEDF